MIKSKADLKLYLKSELKQSYSHWLTICYLKTAFKPTLRFLFLLRICEYYKNCKKGVFNRIIYLGIKYLKYKKSLQLSFSIPENVAKEGLQLPHYGTIVINGNTRIGKNCRIHVCVNIGASGGDKSAPIIGDNVYIGPGAKIYGPIKIADRIAIAANAAVSKSFLNSDVVIGGVPAKEIGSIDIGSIIKEPQID